MYLEPSSQAYQLETDGTVPIVECRQQAFSNARPRKQKKKKKKKKKEFRELVRDGMPVKDGGYPPREDGGILYNVMKAESKARHIRPS
jgi:hypothetical protein